MPRDDFLTSARRAVRICLVLAGVPAGASAQGAIAFTRVSVIDGADSVPRPDQTVVVRGARIVTVGPAETARIPAGALVVDGRGRFLLPGFWDMHVHTALEGGRELLKLYLANGVTGIRDMAGAWDTLKRWRAEIASGRIPGPWIIASGPYLEGGDVPVASILTRTPDEGRVAVDSLVRLGVDFVKVHSRITPATFYAIARRARERGITFGGHVSQALGAAAASDSGQRSIEHLLGIPAPCTPADSIALQPRFSVQGALGRCSSEDLAPLYARLVRNGTWVTPTFTAQVEVAAWPTRAVPGDSLAHYLPGSVRRLVAEIFPMPEGIPAGADSVGRAMLAKRLAQVAMMRWAGVGILTGTDAPLRNSPPGFGLHEEFDLLRRGGLTPFEIIQAATLEPARYFGMLDSAGTVAAGKRADLVLLSGNPLSDIRNTRRIVAVMAAGRLYQGLEREQFLSAGRDSRAASCAPGAGPAEEWPPIAFPGLGLSLRLPPALKPRKFEALGDIARRARASSIPGVAAEQVELAAAWEAPGRASHQIAEVLLYTRRQDGVPPGRPCAMQIGTGPGLVFRTALSGSAGAPGEYWIEAYWPGFVLAASGPTIGAYEAIFRVLRSVAAVR